MDGYEKLSHEGLVSYEDFSSSLNSTITRDEYEQLLKLFKENDCTTMSDRVYNVADVVPFIKAFRKMQGSTIVIKLMFAKTQLVPQAYQ